MCPNVEFVMRNIPSFFGVWEKKHNAHTCIRKIGLAVGQNKSSRYMQFLYV